jgi:hypothetical protein
MGGHVESPEAFSSMAGHFRFWYCPLSRRIVAPIASVWGLRWWKDPVELRHC